MATFFSCTFGMPRVRAAVSGYAVEAIPAYRVRIPGQISEVEAINALGDRRSAYASIDVPTLCVWGSRSPLHLQDRMRAVAAVIPRATAWTVDADHAVQQKRPALVAARLREFYATSG